ncbi:FecR family protein [Parabacteroides pacaensis]|uniref:FecR family protein n=1 Tax=Parabacteroides pacaensis TaxID=2086575 RepID=UPI000D0EEEF9|nr:FecR domain-containing protein [Parabacteroides pacaensis]
MQELYQDFEAVDFLKDEKFLRWRLWENEEDVLFWKKFMDKYPQKKETIEEAIEKINLLKMNDYSLQVLEKKQMWINLNEKIRKRKTRKTRQFYSLLSGAAGIALLVLVTYFMVPFHPGSLRTGEIQKDSISPGKDIVLVLANKKTFTLEQNAAIQYTPEGNVVIDDQKKQLVTQTEDKKTEMNKLIVPRGRRSTLTLADGTKVWINSGTIVEFPPVFNENTRHIYVDGEIYIEVAKNENQPFIVNTSYFKVQVLGTRFNISAYKEEATHSVVLVKGSVEVSSQAGNPVRLHPDEMLCMEENGYTTRKVDVYEYISWKDGILQFTRQPLIQIINHLARYYDLQITCDENIRLMSCSGKLVLFDDINKVLHAIETTVPVKYQKNGNEITFSKNNIN